MKRRRVAGHFICREIGIERRALIALGDGTWVHVRCVRGPESPSERFADAGIETPLDSPHQRSNANVVRSGSYQAVYHINRGARSAAWTGVTVERGGSVDAKRPRSHGTPTCPVAIEERLRRAGAGFRAFHLAPSLRSSIWLSNRIDDMQTILALVPGEALQRLRVALSRSFFLKPIGLHEVEIALNRSDHATLVVDPSILREEAYAALVSAVARAGAPMMLYTSPLPSIAARILATSRVLTPELVFYPAENEPAVLNRLLGQLGKPSVSAIILRRVTDHVLHLGAPLRQATLDLFGWRHMPSSAKAFAAAIRLDEAKVRRWLQRAGFRGSKRLLSTIRVARTCEVLLANSNPLEGTIAQYGFGSVRTLNANFHDLLGCAPQRINWVLDANESASRLVDAILYDGTGES